MLKCNSDSDVFLLFFVRLLTTARAQWEKEIMSSIRFRCKSDSILCTYSSSNAANMRKKEKKSLNYFSPRCDCVLWRFEFFEVASGKCWSDFNEIQIINYSVVWGSEQESWESCHSPLERNDMQNWFHSPFYLPQSFFGVDCCIYFKILRLIKSSG